MNIIRLLLYFIFCIHFFIKIKNRNFTKKKYFFQAKCGNSKRFFAAVVGSKLIFFKNPDDKVFTIIQAILIEFGLNIAI